MRFVGRNDSHSTKEKAMISCVKCDGTGTCLRCRGCGPRGVLPQTPASHRASLPTLQRQRAVPKLPRRRKAFGADLRPDIYVSTSLSTPTSITIAAITGATWRYLPVPDEIPGWPEEDQVEFVGRMCREHYLEQCGKLTLFGEILGYIYRPRRGVYRSFNIDGRTVDDASDL